MRLLESQGYAPVRQGKDRAISCPFHEGDDTPSLIVTPEKNLFHCFGCGASGSVIDWVMRTKGVSFRHAVELLRADIPLAAEAAATPPKRGTVKQLPPPMATEADDQAALAQVIDYYHGTLKQNPEALAYLKRRGLDHPELIERFKLGYANRTLGYRLPDKNRKAGLALRSQLQRLGILRASGHEHSPLVEAVGVDEVTLYKWGQGYRHPVCDFAKDPGWMDSQCRMDDFPTSGRGCNSETTATCNLE